jgi:hypothetical protein
MSLLMEAKGIKLQQQTKKTQVRTNKPIISECSESLPAEYKRKQLSLGWRTVKRGVVCKVICTVEHKKRAELKVCRDNRFKVILCKSLVEMGIDKCGL